MVKEGDEETMSEPMNTRSPQQWEIISKHIDFKGKEVFDLGMGYGDILLKCLEVGAESAAGYDNDKSLVDRFEDIIWERIDVPPGHWGCSHSWAYYKDLNDLNYQDGYCPDVSICFSVLPYLKDPDNVLRWMHDHSEIALIESQYDGDGPGFAHIKNDADMETWLKSIGWQSVEMIGRTLVECRNKERSIWLCR